MYYILRALLAFSFFYPRLSPVRVAKSALVIVVVIIIMILLLLLSAVAAAA
jgi:hypothetical protein